MDVFLNCEKENLLDTENLRKIHIVINDRSGQNLQIDNFIKPLIQQEFHFVEKIEKARRFIGFDKE
ncbi:MAG: hypothetical protein LCH30_08985 [Proteobacteria bacterium]|nr:hypothetical protein [Pseudomonadota bacterium]